MREERKKGVCFCATPDYFLEDTEIDGSVAIKDLFLFCVMAASIGVNFGLKLAESCLVLCVEDSSTIWIALNRQWIKEKGATLNQ